MENRAQILDEMQDVLYDIKSYSTKRKLALDSAVNFIQMGEVMRPAANRWEAKAKKYKTFIEVLEKRFLELKEQM